MRPIERIDIYCALLKRRADLWDFINIMLESPVKDVLKESLFPILKFEHHYNTFKTYWKDNPDLRITQVCVNLGIIDNIPGAWYYTEDYELMKSFGFADRDVFLWGTFGKSGKEPLKRILLKDMEDSHIEAILNTQNISEERKEMFRNELNYRKNEGTTN